MSSIWEKTEAKRDFPALDKSIKTKVLIIGGGLCGILCAYLLHQAGIDYVLAEASTVCSGTTKNTTAKITIQHGLIYRRLIDTFGEEKARLYLQANAEALDRYSKLCRDIDCDFVYKDSFVYSLDGKDKLMRELDAYRRLGYPAELCTSLPLPFPTDGAIKVPSQAQFNPLKFAYKLCEGLRIYEHTRVEELIGNKAVANGVTIQADHIIVATHFPFINKHGSYFLKLYQHRSYVIGLKNAPLPQGMYVDASKSGLSFRSYKDILLIGGGSHRTGKKGGGFKELTELAKKYYPSATECVRFATQDCMSLDGVPYIGRYSARTHNLYTATGFNKWGMTSSMVAAMLLCDLIEGKKNRYSAVFSPSRSILHPQLAVNAWESAVHLLTPSAKRCPHLGCALKWNPHEHTWDCPCHGSRFTKDGKLIDNPATGDLKR